MSTTREIALAKRRMADERGDHGPLFLYRTRLGGDDIRTAQDISEQVDYWREQGVEYNIKWWYPVHVSGDVVMVGEQRQTGPLPIYRLV